MAKIRKVCTTVLAQVTADLIRLSDAHLIQDFDLEVYHDASRNTATQFHDSFRVQVTRRDGSVIAWRAEDSTLAGFAYDADSYNKFIETLRLS